MPAQTAEARRAPSGSAATTRMRKVACPVCGYTVRMARKWIAVGMPTCPCGATMAPEDIEDAAVNDELLYAHPDFRDHGRRETARANREAKRSGWKRGQPTCGACHKFIPHPTADCPCGFHNDGRGYLPF